MRTTCIVWISINSGLCSVHNLPQLIQREERRIKVLTEISYNRKYVLIWVNKLNSDHRFHWNQYIYTSWAYDYHISWNFEHFMRNVSTLVSFQYMYSFCGIFSFNNAFFFLMNFMPEYYQNWKEKSISRSYGFGEIQSKPKT